MKGLGDSFDVVDGYVALRPFHRTDVRTVEAAQVGQFLLTELLFLPQSTDVLGKYLSQTFLFNVHQMPT